MEALFRIKKPATEPDGFRAYWIESSAPLNVDARAGDAAEKLPDTPEMTDVDPDEAIQEIADYLNGSKNPQVVISVHGFNSPFHVVLDRFTAAYRYVTTDAQITRQEGLVCIGYRWPSEAINQFHSSTLEAAPRGLIWVFGIALTLLGAGGLLATPPTRGWFGRNALHSLLYSLGSLLGAVPFTAFLMRILGYYRDGYRAINYGVPDLLEVIRHLDRTVNKGVNPEAPDCNLPSERRVKLSFIGHSMGSVVVTNLVRILSDVFASGSMTDSLNDNASSGAMPPDAKAGDLAEERAAGNRGAAEQDPDAMRAIGHVFLLERLVLVSPDIPAETLLQGRANFLQSSLRRFKEAYLFSNEGDEALRLISTMGNYFSFPTQSRNYGYRLGNVNIVKPPQPGKPEYGIVNLKRLRTGRPGGEACLPPGRPWSEAQQFLCDLRAGQLTLAELAKSVTSTTQDMADPHSPTSEDSPLPARFTYFDCTDYKDYPVPKSGKRGPRPVPVMTFAEGKARLSDGDHFRLLCAYLSKGKPDVHSGYFSFPLTQCLIYRLSCLGLEDTLNSVPPLEGAHSGLEGWSAVCKKHQIQVLLSPLHYEAFVPLDQEGRTRGFGPTGKVEPARAPAPPR